MSALDTYPCQTDAEDRDRIAALPTAYFEPLFTLLPALEGPWPELETVMSRDAEGRLAFSPPPSSPAVEAVFDQCYALHVVLRWSSWSEFQQEHPFTDAHVDRFDRYQCCMALTALVRGERFCDGLLESACRDGTASRIIRRLQVV